MDRVKIILVSSLLLFFIVEDSFGQRFSSRKQYWSVGGSINANNFVGDVTGSKSPMSIDFGLTKLNLSACVVRRVAPRISVRGNLFWGRLKGNDRKSSDPSGADFGRYHRGANFKNDIKELSVTVIADFFENRGTFQRRPDYTPYGFVGLAGLMHNPVTSSVTGSSVGAGDWDTPVSGIGHANFSKLTGAFVYGLGFRYKLAMKWDVAFEIGWRKTFTDWLDGVSGDRVFKNEISNVAAYDRTLTYDNESDYEDLAVFRLPIGASDHTGLESVGAASNYTPEQLAAFTTTNDGYYYYTAQSLPLDEDGEPNQYGDDKGRVRNDGYIVTGFHLTYILEGGVKCPKFR